jgi:hypothetical protein
MDDGRKIILPNVKGIDLFLEERIEKFNGLVKDVPFNYCPLEPERIFNNSQIYEIIIMKDLLEGYKQNKNELSTWNHIFQLSKKYNFVDVNQYNSAYDKIEEALSQFK